MVIVTSRMKDYVRPSIFYVPFRHVKVAIETGKKATDLISQVMREIPLRLACLRGEVVDIRLVSEKVTHSRFQ
jgi:hypothetical protein